MFFFEFYKVFMGTFFIEHFRTTAAVLLKKLGSTFFHVTLQYFKFINLASSANTNCRPFQVKINCSKFIIDGLQQWCYITLLVSLFITSRNLLFDVFLPRKVILILKISVSERCNSLSKSYGIFRQNPFKVPVTKLNI